MAPHTFSSDLKNRLIVLPGAADAVRFSFIVMESISYLDLSQREMSQLRDYSSTTNDGFPLQSLKPFVYTEEQCRKYFTDSRKLLYTLHLDLPSGRECSLKDKSKWRWQSQDITTPIIGIIRRPYDINTTILYLLLKPALQLIDKQLRLLQQPASKENRELLSEPMKKKLKILRFLSRFTLERGYNTLLFVEPYVANSLLDCLYPFTLDASLHRVFLRNFFLAGWLNHYERPEVLEFILRHSRCIRNDRLSLDSQIERLIDLCIYRRFFLNVGPILMYLDSPGFTFYGFHLYRDAVSSLSIEWREVNFREAESMLGQKRLYLIFQFCWIYKESVRLGIPEKASEALYVIWSSSSQHYLTFKELDFVLHRVLPVAELNNMYDFYCNSIDANPLEHVEPRSLQHVSRTAIRRTLKVNEIWIPDGIGQLKLPPSLEAYLNLERYVPIVICDMEIDK